MSYSTFRPIIVDRFGGLVTLMERTDLPNGLSPACQDVEFFPGGVRSRSGSTVALTPSPTNIYHWNGMLSWVQRSGTRRLLGFQSNGQLWYEAPEGTLNSLDTTRGVNLYMQGSALYGRAYLAFSDGKRGYAPAVEYDGTSLTRFSTGPPGSAPTFADGGAGSVIAGTRVGAVSFRMRDGTITAPCWLPVSDEGIISGFTTAGAKVLAISNVPIGPPGTIGRVIFVSVAGTGTTVWSSSDLFFLPGAFELYDNSATSLTVDFTEAELLGGIPMSSFMDNEPLAPIIGSTPYHDRIVTWGAIAAVGSRDNAQAFLRSNAPEAAAMRNFRWDGGGLTGVPNGWTQVVAGGTLATSPGAPNSVWKITGDGATAVGGKISYPAVSGGLDVGLISAALTSGVEYGIRVRLKKSAGAVAGRILFNLDITALTSGVIGIPPLTFQVPVSSIGVNWAEFSGTFGTIQPSFGGVGLVFSIGSDQAITAGEWVAVESVEFYRTADPPDGLDAVLRISRAFEPSRFSNTDGFIFVNKDDGETIRCCFVLRDNLYIAKERSLWVTRDDGQNEPSGWPVSLVSSDVGTYSTHGVAMGEGWAAIVSRAGLYLFDGGIPSKLSQEIQPTWDALSWEYGHHMWVVVDVEARRIYVACVDPTLQAEDDPNAPTDPNRLLVLDYTEGMGQEQRKWSSWTLVGNSGELVERADLKRRFFLGSNDDTGVIYQYDTDAVDDNGTLIDSFYETAPLGPPEGIALFGGMEIFAGGAGALLLQADPPDGVLDPITSLYLADPIRNQLEFPLHISSEKIGLRVGMTAVDGGYWSVNRIVALAKSHPFAPMRGRNP